MIVCKIQTIVPVREAFPKLNTPFVDRSILRVDQADDDISGYHQCRATARVALEEYSFSLLHYIF